MQWKVAILGHSIARDLNSLGAFNGIISEDHSYTLQFFFISGSCFRTWLDWPQKLHDLIEWEPHLIFLVLGSNSVLSKDSVKNLVKEAETFYRVLKNSLPQVVIVQCQIELRFLDRFDFRGNPPRSIYRSLRNTANKALLKCPLKDHFCMIGGKGRLDDETLYRPDKIHFTREGLSRFRAIIRHTIVYIVRKRI